MSHSQSVILDHDVYEIVQAHRGHKSVSRTINDLIRRSGRILEYQDILRRVEDLIEQNLAISQTEFDTKLEARRAAALAELRNEPR